MPNSPADRLLSPRSMSNLKNLSSSIVSRLGGGCLVGTARSVMVSVAVAVTVLAGSGNGVAVSVTTGPVTVLVGPGTNTVLVGPGMMVLSNSIIGGKIFVIVAVGPGMVMVG